MGRSFSDFKLYGIFGFPLGHTLSPVMQEAAFRHAGVGAFYLALELRPREFHRAMQGLGRFLLEGFNVTVPYKGAVLKYLGRRLTPRAKAIGAVNTVFRRRGRWFGDNTDGRGFLASLKREGRFHPRGKSVLILGAGGAARAVAYVLAQSGAGEILILNRRRFQARRRRLIREFSKFFPGTVFAGEALTRGNLKQGFEGAELIVNATSVGVHDEGRRLFPGSLIPDARKSGRLLFFDLVYHRRTAFLADAKRKGHRILGGLGMLAYQGAEAFRLWTGSRAPVAVMRRTLQRALAGKGA